jgi:hypothetical protein
VAEHYGQRAERYRAMAQGYMDDRLREVFPPVRSGGRPAADLIVRHREWLQALLVRWSSLDAPEVEGIMSKLLDRARALQLAYSSRAAPVKLVALGSLATSLAMDYAYTGRFIG